MMKVTGFPSGQRLVCALQTFAKSGRASAFTGFALFEMTAKSRAIAGKTQATKNKKMLVTRPKDTHSPAGEIGPGVIFVQFAPCLNGHEGHVPLEPPAGQT